MGLNMLYAALLILIREQPLFVMNALLKTYLNPTETRRLK
jgi:hypothetical protein